MGSERAEWGEAAGRYGEELRRWMLEWVETWQDDRLEVFGISEHGRALVLESRWHLAAPQTGGAVPASDFNVVLWFRS